jgi:TPR repeat protein
MYENGYGVVEDYVEAYKWTLLAGMNGGDVTDRKAWLRKRMTAGQIINGGVNVSHLAGG